MLDQYVPFECIKRFGNLFNTFVAFPVEQLPPHRQHQSILNRNPEKKKCCYGDSNPSRERERLA